MDEGGPSQWLLQRTEQWVEGRLAAGFKVAVFNMLPRGYLTEKQMATREAFNAALPGAIPRALVIDVCAPPGELGTAPMWRPDRVHPTREGQAWMLKERVRPALQRLASE